MDVFELGNWVNIAEMEETLNLDELYALQSALYRKEHRRNKMMAGLKGINLDDVTQEEVQEQFDRVEREAQAKISGRSKQEVDFDMLGIAYERDDD